MNVKNLLLLAGLVLGSSACMAQTKPAPDTSPLPDSASIAELSATQARRLEAERRSGVIFETSRPGKILVDGQAPGADSASDKAVKPEKTPEKQPEAVPAVPVEPVDGAEEQPDNDPDPSGSQD